MVPSKLYYTVAAVIGFCLIIVTVTETEAMPSIPSNIFGYEFLIKRVPDEGRAYYNDVDEPSEETLLQLLARLRQTLFRAQGEFENSKRTVDFGLARGYSGAQEAKHRLGLAAANYAGGPGRRRRSETEA